MKTAIGRIVPLLIAALVLAACSQQGSELAPLSTNQGKMSINVVLNTDATPQILAELGRYGTVRKVLEEIDGLTMQADAAGLAAIQALPFVAAANPDAERSGVPVNEVEVENFLSGLSSWDQDAINVTDKGPDNRQVTYDGTGVYVAVLDTGLLDSWRDYFPDERIAEEYAIAFAGGGGERGSVSSQPNKWEHDQNSHGTHVTSTILGYSLGGTPINGTAPMATVIPVKVLNQNGSGWSSVVAEGINYVADLKESGELGDSPVVINMSLGGPAPDALTQAAIDRAIKAGIIVVAAAGNEGEAGMGYPGAYPPVISAAASGWTGEWTAANWWYKLDVPDPTNPENYYITDFSSRTLHPCENFVEDATCQDLDVAAPGSWVVGPYQINSGNSRSYYYLGGTSMASPHVAGIAALMAQKAAVEGVVLTAQDDNGVTEAERILEESAIGLPAGCRNIVDPNVGPTSVCWDDDASGSGLTTADKALAGVAP